MPPPRVSTRPAALTRLPQLRDVAAVAAVTSAAGVPLKVILETCLLEEGQVHALTMLCRELGAEFVKTSTGFGGGGATEAAVRTMATAGAYVEPSGVWYSPPAAVKASGGVRTLLDALRMIKAGANRVGASASVRIMEELAALQDTSADTARSTLEGDGVHLQHATRR